MKIKEALKKYYDLCRQEGIISDYKSKEMLQNEKKYYDVNKLLSYNEYTYFCVMSPRNVGKTFNFQNTLILNCFKKGGCMLWLRRDVEQVKKINTTWLAKNKHLGYLEDNKFRKIVTSSKGVKCILFDEKNKPYFSWYLVQFFSIIHENRVQGDSFINPMYIVYDEALVPDGRYKSNEEQALLSISSSFFRTNKMKIFALCNYVTKKNWLFDLFNLDFKDNIEFQKSSYVNENLKGDKIKTLCLTHNFKYNATQLEHHNNLDVMSKLKGNYLKFAQGKMFYLDNEKNILPTNNKNLKHLYNIKYDKNYFGVYKYNEFLYISKMQDDSKYNYYFFRDDIDVNEPNFTGVGYSLIYDTLNAYIKLDRIVYNNLKYKKAIENLLRQKREN